MKDIHFWIKKIMNPPGSALPDFEIFKRISNYWGCGDLFTSWKSPGAVFEILKEISKGQPCDISGIKDYEMISESGGIQWPYPENNSLMKQERRLFENGKYFHSNGKARFLFSDIDPVPEKSDQKYPYILLTGRGTVAQWHTQTRTGKVEMLKKMYPEEPYVEINIEDADRHQIKNNEWVKVYSRRGDVDVKAVVGDFTSPGELFMPMHYFETNQLTFPSFDPQSREPSYKYASVNLKKL